MKFRIEKKKLYVMVILLAVVLVGARLLIFWQVKRTIVAQVENLRSAGILFRYTTLEVNPWKGNLRMEGISIGATSEDSLCRSRATIPMALLENIHIIPLITSHKLVVGSVALSHPSIHFGKRLGTLSPDTERGNSPGGLVINRLRMDSLLVETLSASCQPTLVAALDFSLVDLEMKNLSTGSLSWRVANAAAEDIRIALPAAFYTITLQKLAYSRDNQTFRIDSLNMLPALNRMEFAKQARHQIDQISCQIPAIQMHGFRISETLTPAIQINQIALQFKVEVFRDKRYPNARRKPSILPIQFMHKLPFNLHADSLLISPSFVSYHEVPETGGVPGVVFFNKLQGGIYNISTDSVGKSTMKVSSRFMNAGDLNVEFTFPLARNKQYELTGSLRNFDMKAINPMLLPIASMEIQSGAMQALNFQFQYDEDKSVGGLDLRYTDLKVHSIRHNKQKSVNKVLTFLINTLVQKTLNKHDTKNKRSGTIKWERDSQAGLLNYWWKSVLSGLKSLFTPWT